MPTTTELIKRDKVNLDILLKDEALEESVNHPPPDLIAAEIVEYLQAALEQFAEIANDFETGRRRPAGSDLMKPPDRRAKFKDRVRHWADKLDARIVWLGIGR